MLRGNIIKEGILLSMCLTPDLPRQRLRWRALLVHALRISYAWTSLRADAYVGVPRLRPT